jgi:phosphohistidine swiveling domain-containing protein
MPDLGKNEDPIRPEQRIQQVHLSNEQRKRIDAALKEEGFPELDAHKLMAYVQEAIAGREYGKFIFTRTVSDILELIANFGEQHGLSREEMSHIALQHLLDVASRSNEVSIEERLRSIAEYESEQHELSVAIRLPQVLFDEAGVHVVPFQVSHPNFITHKKVTALAVALSVGGEIRSLASKIILIENADPGFDWIFSQPISGLITKYGGANSHMAIRCAEFGIPAAIGCGEQRFEAFLKAAQISLDCAAGLINPLH